MDFAEVIGDKLGIEAMMNFYDMQFRDINQNYTYVNSFFVVMSQKPKVGVKMARLSLSDGTRISISK